MLVFYIPPCRKTFLAWARDKIFRNQRGLFHFQNSYFPEESFILFSFCYSVLSTFLFIMTRCWMYGYAYLSEDFKYVYLPWRTFSNAKKNSVLHFVLFILFYSFKFREGSVTSKKIGKRWGGGEGASSSILYIGNQSWEIHTVASFAEGDRFYFKLQTF